MASRIFKHSAIAAVIMLFNCFMLTAQQQLNNSSFEDWEEIRSDVFEPLHWNSIKNNDGSRTTNHMAPEVASKTEIAHSGKYALKLVNKSTMGIVANGMLTNGAIHGDMDKSKSFVYTNGTLPGFFTPFTSRPDSVTGWYRYTPVENDSALVVVMLHDCYITLPGPDKKSCWVGAVKVMLPATGGDKWVRFSAPINYFRDIPPVYIVVVFSAGNRQQAVEGSVAYFDDLQLIYNK